MDMFRSGIDRVSILTSWVLYGYIFRVFFGFWVYIIGLGIFYFGQVVFKVLGGNRVDLYASDGASFACCYKIQIMRISRIKVR